MVKKFEESESKFDIHKWGQTLMTAAITVMVGIILNLTFTDHEKLADHDKRLAILEYIANIKTEIPKDYINNQPHQYAILPKDLEIPNPNDLCQ